MKTKPEIEKAVLEVIKEIVGKAVTLDATPNSVGMDSLDYVTAFLDVEEKLSVEIDDDWFDGCEEKSFKDIAEILFIKLNPDGN